MTVTERLATIENELIHIKDSLKEIQENHLQHIYEKLDVLGQAAGDLKNCVDAVQNSQKQKWKPKDYAAVLLALAAFITALAAAFR